MKDNEQTKIWRYIDLGKFASLLATEKLYFACPCEFEDPYEGFVPKSHVEAELRIFQEQVNQLLLLTKQLAAQSASPNELNPLNNKLVSCQHCSVVNNVIYFFIIDLEDWDYEEIQRYAYRRGT